MRFGTLVSVAVGSVVVLSQSISGEKWRVLEVRDVGVQPLHPVTYKLRPEVIRGRYSVKLQNTQTGRLRTVYRAENLSCQVVS